MLNAAEAAMDATAEDDAERQRNKAALYAPPRDERRRTRTTDTGGGRPTGLGLDRAAARALVARVAAEDAQLTGSA